MKITKAIIKQKDQEYILRCWTELEPSRFDYNTVGGTLPPMHVQDLSKRVELWQKSFKEVRIHPSCLEVFKGVAREAFCNNQDQFVFFSEFIKKGIEIPPENIKISIVVSGKVGEEIRTPYAFLVEGKKETPESKTLISEHKEIDTLAFFGFHTNKESNKDQEELKKRSDKIELLESFALFLECNSYLDTDWRTEKPFAIDEFLRLNP